MRTQLAFALSTLLWAATSALPPCVPMDSSSVSLLRSGEESCCKLGKINSVCGDSEDDGDGIVVDFGDLSGRFAAAESHSVNASSRGDSPAESERILGDRSFVARVLAAGGGDIKDDHASLRANVPSRFALTSSKPMLYVNGWIVIGKSRLIGTFNLRQFNTAGIGMVQAVTADLKMLDFTNPASVGCIGRQVAVVDSPKPVFFDRNKECTTPCMSPGICADYLLCAKATGAPGEALFAIVKGSTVYEFVVLSTNPLAGDAALSFKVKGFFCDTAAITMIPLIQGLASLEINPATGGHTVVASSVIFSGGQSPGGIVQRVQVANV